MQTEQQEMEEEFTRSPKEYLNSLMHALQVETNDVIYAFMLNMTEAEVCTLIINNNWLPSDICDEEEEHGDDK